MMHGWRKKESFLQGLNIARGNIVSITGAGGKTSLLFLLAREARCIGYRVLVTTTTRILIPDQGQYDRIDLNCTSPRCNISTTAEIHVIGSRSEDGSKLTGCDLDTLRQVAVNYDLLLIEADGSAGKRLKGWNAYEPVIPDFTTTTIGVVDISVIGCSVSKANIHRLSRFQEITEAWEDDKVERMHLQKLIEADCGLFQHAGNSNRIVYFNKMESRKDFHNAGQLRQLLPKQRCVGGSILQEKIYV